MVGTTFVGHIDVAELALITFTLFFVALILYLRREDRREGYPLEDDLTGRLEAASGMFFTARPKTFIMAGGTGTVSVPHGRRDSPLLNARRTAPWSGSPYEPQGDPLQAGVGPGAYAQRARTPDLTLEGHNKIVPMRVASDFSIAKGDPDPRGMPVVGADGQVGGVVSDLWIDRAEHLIRYVEIETPGAAGGPARRVLAPMPMAVVERGRRRVRIPALLAAQFADAPALESADQITLFEEERVSAYFGAGYLYATAKRSEPWL